MAFNPKSFTEGAKPLPVLLLLDVSGSMSGEKIVELNKAVREMIADFKHEAQMETEIKLSIITFGGDAAELQLPFTPVSRIEMVDMEAEGMTPMGDALRQAKAMIENKEQTIDLKMKNLDTEISSLTTEYDTTKSIISKAIEKGFKRYEA